MSDTQKWKNKFCKFLLWDKLVFTFTFYFAVLLTFIILGWLLATTPTAKNFFNTYDMNFTINLLNDPNVQQNFLLSGIFNIVALIGFLSLFCYIFYLLNRYGIKGGFVGTDAKMFPVLMYAFIFATVISGGIISSYCEQYLGNITLYGSIQIIYLGITFVFVIWSVLVLEQIYPKKYEEYREMIIFLDKTVIFKNYEFTSLCLLFLIFGTPIFGGILRFNLATIICLDLMLLFIVGILGTINSLPIGLTNIYLKTGSSILSVYVLTDDGSVISFLDSNDKIRKITKDSIETYGVEKLEVQINPSNLTKTVANFLSFQYQDYEINSNCRILSKLNMSFLQKICIFSVILGFLFYPYIFIYVNAGFNVITVVINSLIIGIPMGVIIHEFYKLFPDGE
jgi:hypothetical protein